MKAQLILALALVMGMQAQAQQRLAQYDEATNTVVEVEVEQKQPQQRRQVIDAGSSPIVILNNQGLQGQGQAQAAQAAQAQVQEQPNTTVEASPLAESRAEKMRKTRQGIEIHTEQKIVEKLEEARIEDEKARADRLFGNGFGSGRHEQPAPAPVAPAPVEPTPVVVVPPPQPQVVVVEKEREERREEKEEKVDVRSEVRMAIEDANKKEEKKSQFFVGGAVGMAEYQDADNVKGNVATGLTVGMQTTDNVVVEGTFLYSDFDVDDYDYMTNGGYPFKSMSQYNFLAAVKYQFMGGSLRPFIGGVVGYTHRTAENRTDGGYYYPTAYGYGESQEGSSNAFDVGLTGGLDIQLTKSFAIGAEARYMTNVSYKRDYEPVNWYGSSFQESTPIEKLDYYTLTLGGKFTF